ncbi:hypothetical protein SLS60_001141 [Paraconiothyrium brasiliense]|uniref:Uncharacterized protein n=1 Tax=Paraconiothyrium brasiliense TaxID=300254 RepID=A0ABR3S885_9PLEO
MPTPNPDIVRPAYQHPTLLPGKKSWSRAPTSNTSEAKAMDQRRPKRAVKGHTRKHAKNAVESQCLIDVKAIVLTSSLQKTSRVGAYLCLVCSGKAHIPLEALQGEYTAYNARVIGEEERPYAAQDHETVQEEE